MVTSKSIERIPPGWKLEMVSKDSLEPISSSNLFLREGQVYTVVTLQKGSRLVLIQEDTEDVFKSSKVKTIECDVLDFYHVTTTQYLLKFIKK